MTTNTATQSYPWDATYPKDVDWNATLTPRPLFEFLEDTVKRYGKNPAMDFLGHSYDYTHLGGLVNRAAKGFQKMGVGKGTKVGLCLPNTPYSVIFFFAVLKAGGTVVNYNPLYVERELANQIEDSETEIMVTMDLNLLYSKVGAILGKSKFLKTIVVCPMKTALPPVKGFLFGLLKGKELAKIPDDDRHVHFDKLIDNNGDPAPVDISPAEDIAVLQYTGGTTGVPKGAMLTHANISANVQQVVGWFPGVMMGEEKILGILPFFHVFAMTSVMMFAVSIGAEMILLPRFELKQALKTINARRPTLFPAVPTIYTAINNAPDLAKYDMSSIKFCISGGAPLPLEVKKRFEELTGCGLVEGYGLSESSPVATCNPLSGATKEGSIGIPVSQTIIEIRDLEDPDTLLPQGERGEVCIIGPQVMLGYWNRPQETGNVLRDGRLHTGDVGYIDEDGYIFLVDRIKDMILCSGFNVYPRIIEEAIYLNPAVAEVTVIGIDDEYRGQSPKAFVKLKEGQTLDEDGMKAFLADKISKIEMPSVIEFRDELPKTMIGKLSKKELVAEEAAKAGKGTA
ncbi:MAG: long-chain fatty acid--CoA ligase [Rhodospirillales bacterium]|nr:long-chain fatty acid--CoA ligase [Rhodospirillales bacterium]MCW9001251.1 long-chain fatty acid--CoA ligase [Rhodospirillales bacterium]MCW9039708.1 long-chain fatty acid--CoA ligase [Rhodospirillales bacterium]